MQIVINIPEKEFGIDIEDRFQDFFSMLKAEIKEHLINNTNLVCGAYELETIDMFLKAFNNSIPLPKGHGSLIDADALEKKMCDREEELGDDRALWESSAVSVALDMFAPTIIEADRSEEE